MDGEGALYDRIGTGYDATRRPEPSVLARITGYLGVASGALVLDLACGTGNYSAALLDAGYTVTGVDISETMLSAAAAKAPRPWLVRGDAGALPFADAAFDYVVCTLAIHHFPDLAIPFAEARRVLGPGCFVIFTADPEQMRGYWLNNYFPEMMARASAAMPATAAIVGALRGAGFERVERADWRVPARPVDNFLYAGKANPALYLDPSTRANISSFANLADADEVEAGVAGLARDIRSGEIDRVRASYSDSLGDYLFVRAS